MTPNPIPEPTRSFVNFVIAIHEPPDQAPEDENTAWDLAADAADELTAEMQAQLGPGWRATLDA